jgi:hypothetical protein
MRRKERGRHASERMKCEREELCAVLSPRIRLADRMSTLLGGSP